MRASIEKKQNDVINFVFNKLSESEDEEKDKISLYLSNNFFQSIMKNGNETKELKNNLWKKNRFGWKKI